MTKFRSGFQKHKSDSSADLRGLKDGPENEKRPKNEH